MHANGASPAQSFKDRRLTLGQNHLHPAGTEHVLEGEKGMSVMELATKHDVPGIEADCGGACSCATCHVYVDPAWTEVTGTADEMEEDMLDFAFDVRENSRLSCQLEITEAFDGLIVRIPEKQF